MPHPYADLPDSAFWKTGVAEANPLELQGLYRKRFEIEPRARIASAGSCFAQHIGRQFKKRGFAYLDTERSPLILPAADRPRYGYDMYSGRFGNVYTARQLLQLYQRAIGQFQPADDVWEQDGRFFDPFRPSIEPGGFGSAEEVRGLRDRQHLPQVKKMFQLADVFVFTLGLTEAWIDKTDGSVYPVCPGTVAGRFDPQRHEFRNFTFQETYRDLAGLIKGVMKKNRTIRLILTVSPVPLTATASGQHVLAATTYSKSVLRAVAGELAATFDNVDYFPSYELITAPAMRGMFFMPNMREVSQAGVDHVMGHFFSEHLPPAGGRASTSSAREVEKAETETLEPEVETEERDAADVICDEEKLELVRT